VHLVRNPYDLYLSARNTWFSLVGRYKLQTATRNSIEAAVLRYGQELMGQYLADRSLVPSRQLAEVRFEDLEAEPLAELRRIYQSLDLPNFDAAEPPMRAYLDTVAGYRKNQFRLENADVRAVNQAWGFMFDEWGYPRTFPA
jgi:hypothetical protein